MIETLLGGVFGGLLRLAPEAFKLFDRANERKHELAMLNAEMEFAKIRGEIAMRQTEAQMTVAELDAMSEALKEQGQTARAAGKFVAAISALVRPLVTYWFVILYSVVKVLGMALAVQAGGEWKEVIVNSWTQDDMTLLMLLLTFWFTGRIFERNFRS
jgi:ABC-type multidrug transport system fused ATPase/permease subunit